MMAPMVCPICNAKNLDWSWRYLCPKCWADFCEWRDKKYGNFNITRYLPKYIEKHNKMKVQFT